MGGAWLEDAEQAYEDGDLEQAHERARRGLADDPANARLLRVAGRSALELDRQDATGHLRRLTEVLPDDGEAWRDLGLALVGDGLLPDAAHALRRALSCDPGDSASLVSLAHVTYALGDVTTATELLAQAAEQAPDNVDALRNLVEMYRTAGKSRAALERAEQLVQQRPDDVLGLIDVAALHLEMGDHDEALAAFGRLREVDDEPGHPVYAHHGMIEVEIHRRRWRRGLDLAIAATEVDRHQTTTDLLAYISVQLFGPSGRSAPTWEQLSAQLTAERAEHRRQHAEGLFT